jgi:alpha-N-acetylgalactosaminidase
MMLSVSQKFDGSKQPTVSIVAIVSNIKTVPLWSMLLSSISFMQFGIVVSLDNGLARTPPMGWLSWERFGCQTNCIAFPETCISEKLYLVQAKLLIELGLKDVGYVYVNIDDCWSERHRDETTKRLLPDKSRFPRGMKFIARTLHSWDLKLGLYGDIGSQTCVGYPGFKDHFDLDAQTLAEWEIDSIKVDACNANESLFNITYPAFGHALNKTGRPILYSCSWPNDYYEKHNHYEKPDYLNYGIKQTCNAWRNYFDVFDSWESIQKIINFWGRTGPNDVMIRAAGPGHFNDPDMLVVGNPGLSISEQQSQFCLWAIFAAPLLFSADLRNITKSSLDILLNREIIAVSQDVLGRQGWCAEHDPSSYTRIWIRELEPMNRIDASSDVVGFSDRWAVVLENYNTIFNAREITFDPKRHLPRLHKSKRSTTWNIFYVRDLIQQKDVGVFQGAFSAVVDESSVSMFLVTRQEANATSDGVSVQTK